MPAEESRAFWTVAPGQGEIREEPLTPVSADDVVVRTLYSGISRGTEALVFQGRVPPSEYRRMRAPFQAGEFPGPVKYGYASVGRIERGPRDLVDRIAFVLHPHQTRFVVPASSAFVVPPDVPPCRGVLAANLETAINGIWDARPQIGDRIAVIGGGTVGCLAAWLATRILGCEVQLIDVNPHRGSVARSLGVDFASPQTAADGVDIAIHASGSADGLALAMKIAAFEATIVELSWYGTDVVPLALGEGFHARRLTLTASQVGHVARSQRPRWDTRRRMQFALALLSHSELDALVTGESDFESLPDVMAQLATAPGDTLCHRIRYQPGT
ncbi:MAG TPA: zinc-binding alcohol dehydrogenase [Vicinamibacterales bacterium]|jgi:threonine dehydrogenase-like Zn-dependent dehydrogenase|nr:zinc-binding alcohol dehydrogenase [Vicinamibacterales bacterium]